MPRFPRELLPVDPQTIGERTKGEESLQIFNKLFDWCLFVLVTFVIFSS